MQKNQVHNYPLATLYVGDLDSNVTEAHLYETFSAVGQVLSIRVCRDQITRQSLGYAYVNFQQPADAERALDTMNFNIVNSRPMRIMWSQRDPSLRKSGVGNVFIKNIDKSINNESLYDTFSAFGNILSCKIMTDEKSDSKGFGFVHFETQEAADKAVESVNNMLLNGKKVFVGKFLTKSERIDHNSTVKKKFTNVFVKNFDDLLNDDKLRETFAKFGEITSAVVARHPDGKSKGYGFCNFRDPSSADQACAEMNEFELDGRKLTVTRHQKKNERVNELKKKYEAAKRERRSKYEGVNLYIKNLDDRVDDEKLREEFSKFGTITSAKVMKENGRSKGFAFVCFKGPEEATRAVSEMRGKIVGSKPLYVALAQLKDERRSHLISQYKNYINNLRMNQSMYVPPSNAMYLPSNVYPAMYQTMQRATPRWTAGNTRPQQQGGPAGTSPAYQTFQMYNPSAQQQAQTAQQQQSQQQRGRLNQVPIQLRPTAMNRMNYMNAQQQQFVRGNQYAVNGAPVQIPQQSQQQQQAQNSQQQQVKRVGKSGKDEETINIAGQPPLTTNMLASANPQEQKQMLGERLYPLIFNIYPDWAGKITGMLLEIDNAELLHMLDSQESLREKVEEAFNVLKAHQAKSQT
jgi:polyadenylate-binding protein